MARKKPKTMSDQMRELIANCGETRYRIAQNTGLSESMLSKFATGRQGLSMAALDVLGAYLHWEVRSSRSGAK